MDLPDGLPVTVIGGKPAVQLNWGSIEDVDTETKADVLLSYLRRNPDIGSNELTCVLSTHVRDEILKNGSLNQYYQDQLEEMGLGDLRNCNCDEGQADNMITIINNMRNSRTHKTAIEDIIAKFTNDLLILESTLQETGRGDTPFTDFYTGYFTGVSTDGVVKIYRNGKLIHTESKRDNTSYTDTSVPTNDSGKIEYYTYFLVNETDCSSLSGDSGKAQINPVVSEGTDINVDLDLKIKVKEAYDDLVMDKVHELILRSMQNSQNLLSNQLDIDLDPTYDEENIFEDYDQLCEDAKSTFAGKRNSENTLNYLLECYGGANTLLREKIEQRQSEFVTLLLLMINNLSDNLTYEQIIDGFMDQVIPDLEGEIAVETEIFNNMQDLDLNLSLLNKDNISDLSDDEKAIVKFFKHDILADTKMQNMNIN